MSTGAISVLNGMLPDTKITEPYSPMPRAKASANPVTVAGSSGGIRPRQNVCQRVAPRHAAASSTSASMSTRIGCTVRTMNGSPMKVSTRTLGSRGHGLRGGKKKRRQKEGGRGDEAQPRVGAVNAERYQKAPQPAVLYVQ